MSTKVTNETNSSNGNNEIQCEAIRSTYPHRGSMKIARTLQKENYKLRKILILLVVCLGLSIAAVAFFATSYITEKANSIELENEYNQVNAAYNTLQATYDGMYDEYEDMYNYTLECEDTISQMYDILTEIEAENESLVESNDYYVDQLDELTKRSELYDKYEYCITYGGERTDITYDQLETVESLCEEKGVDEDLVLAIVMVESTGDETACNSSSSARGYGQFLKSTGEFVYEDLMNAGTYNHDYALDGTTNLTMMVNLLEYMEDNTSSTTEMIKWYRGEGGSVLTSYINKINSYLSQVGKSVYTLGQDKVYPPHRNQKEDK